MTGRARWLLLLGMTGFVLGILRNRSGLSLLSLSVLTWLALQWLIFHLRLWLEIPALRLTRRVNGRAASDGILFSGRTIAIVTEVRSNRGTMRDVMTIEEYLPENVNAASEASKLIITSPQTAATAEWSGKVLAAGRLIFRGARLTVTDSYGLFTYQRFLKCEQKFRVLPGYRQAGDLQPLIKRINSLPSHGIHRLQRAGMGSELLELREYVPGDPPKSIAWKVSARRGTLMTRQYESEVPVRMTLFVDGSIGNRLGGFGCRLLDQMLYVAASVARSSFSVGDPVGAVLFNETTTTRIRHVSGESGFFQLLGHFADFAVNPKPPFQKLTPALIDSVIRLSGVVCPDLLAPSVNRVPFTWLPFSPLARRRHFRRFQVAAILAEFYGLTPHQQMTLVHDDQAIVGFCVRFLNEAGMAWMDPVVPNRSTGYHDSMSTVESLNTALAHSVARARDNELYVLLANLLESHTSLSRLLPGLKLALARHHRVVVVCPTPTFRRPDRNSGWPESMDAQSLLQHAENLRMAELTERLQRQLRRLGATVSVSGEEEALQVVASELQLIRTGRTAGIGS